MRKAGTMEDLVQGQHGSLKNGLEIPFVAPNWLSQHSYKGWEAQINSQLLLHPYYFEFQPPFFLETDQMLDFPNILLVFHHDSTAPRFGAAPHGIPCWALRTALAFASFASFSRWAPQGGKLIHVF
jgi:hypothetical protein